MLVMMLAGIATASTGVPLAAQGPRVFTNLQFLPEDITTAELFENMKRLTRALGAECRSCHRTDIRDFATDEIEAKRIAREMMVMVKQMNEELSPAGAKEAAKTTCFTCHRGRRKPATSAPTGADDS